MAASVGSLQLNRTGRNFVDGYASDQPCRHGCWILASGAVGAIVGLVLLRSTGPDYSTIKLATTTDLEREFDALRETLDIPGLSAAISEGNQIVWARGFGYADLDRRSTVDPRTTSFHLASVTKPYTATVVLQLADERRLELDSPVSKFGVSMPTGAPVRVWHLLPHTSARTPGSAYPGKFTKGPISVETQTRPRRKKQ